MDFQESYAGLPDAERMAPGVPGAWSVRDIIAHVTWWEEEALTHLPVVLAGGRPPRYSVTHGGIDAFNAKMTEQRRHWSLAQVLAHQVEVHRRLVAFVAGAPADQTGGESRVPRRAVGGERWQRAEPFLALYDSNPRLLAASAFTPNPGGSTSATAPIYVT